MPVSADLVTNIANSGALGLNTAVADVGTLYDCLMAIQEDKADDSILDVYSDARREKFQKIVDPQSQGTLRSVFSDPSDLSSIPMYKFSQLLKNNPEIAKKNAPVRIQYPSKML